jgi:hypothetical protein
VDVPPSASTSKRRRTTSKKKKLTTKKGQKLATIKKAGGPAATTAKAASPGTTTTTTTTTKARAVAEVSVSPQVALLPAGKSVQLQAVAKNAQGQPVTGLPVKWISTNPSVISVSNTGLATRLSSTRLGLWDLVVGALSRRQASEDAPKAVAVFASIDGTNGTSFAGLAVTVTGSVT